MAATSGKTTLIYTLKEDQDVLTYSDFELILRSLYSANVISFVPDQETRSIRIEVSYFANIANARKRLGGASEYIDVSRLSELVRPDELQTLANLRARFGFGVVHEDEESEAPPKRKKARYAGGH